PRRARQARRHPLRDAAPHRRSGAHQLQTLRADRRRRLADGDPGHARRRLHRRRARAQRARHSVEPGLRSPGAARQAREQAQSGRLQPLLGRDRGRRRRRRRHLGLVHGAGEGSARARAGRRRFGEARLAPPFGARAAGAARRGARGRESRARRRADAFGPVLSLPALVLRAAARDARLPPPRTAADAARRNPQQDREGAGGMNIATAPKPFAANDYKSDYKPVWCPGCGDYSVLLAFTKAMAALQRPPEDIAVISGIGCSSRIPAYTNCYGFHGVHGRALAVGTGLKVARPELTVIVAGGDGDGFSIGGNHFLHACRRNVDLTYIVMDNHVYGMTKGQPSPTTEPDWDSKLAPGGTGMRVFHPLVIALAAGANFIARAFSGDP